MASTFYALMQRRGDGKVYADLHKSLPTIFLTDTDARRVRCIDGSPAMDSRDVVELVALTRHEYDELASQAEVSLGRQSNLDNQRHLLGQRADKIADLSSQVRELQAALELVCKTSLGQYTYSTWSLTATASQRALMQKSLCAIAFAKGKSTFGNDWQEALS